MTPSGIPDGDLEKLHLRGESAKSIGFGNAATGPRSLPRFRRTGRDLRRGGCRNARRDTRPFALHIAELELARYAKGPWLRLIPSRWGRFWLC